MADRIKEFIEDSKALVGKEAKDVPSGTDLADWLTIRKYCSALGDANPLYKDPASGVATKYNSMIAPNTFVVAIRTPDSTAAHVKKDYSVVPFTTHARMEWVDIIRVGDRLKSTLKVADVRAGKKWGGRNTAEVVSQATYRNSYGGVIGTATGTVTLVSYERGRGMLVDRDIYRYSDQEIRKLEKDIESEPPIRGKKLRYWDEVKVGEKLAQLVKGPVTLSDMVSWKVGEAKSLRLGQLVVQDLKTKYPGRVRTNPSTNSPVWDADHEYEDILSCQDMGFKSPVTRGLQRVCLASQLCTDWMGDAGFLRALDVQLSGHWLYGDTMRLNGTVTAKRKEEIGRETYYAVDTKMTGINQLGEPLLEGKATVFLPNPGHSVTLPIPH